MTWMRRNLIAPVSTLALLLIVGATGCGPSEKDLKIQDLTAENEQLKNELNDRDRQLNDALVRENEARSSIDELNRELSRARADASKATAQPSGMDRARADGWIAAPSFDMISVPGSVLFSSGKADITRRGRGTLTKIAGDIRSQYGDRDIYVFGHTDSQPIRKSKWKDNWELGAARARSVVKGLHGAGIPAERLILASCGQHRPKANNSTNSGRKQNRRVEFYAVKRGGSMFEASARGFGE